MFVSQVSTVLYEITNLKETQHRLFPFKIILRFFFSIFSTFCLSSKTAIIALDDEAIFYFLTHSLVFCPFPKRPAQNS